MEVRPSDYDLLSLTHPLSLSLWPSNGIGYKDNADAKHVWKYGCVKSGKNYFLQIHLPFLI